MSYRSIFRPALFEDRVVVVTGGGSGIGRCIAHELVSLGAAVAIVGRKLDKLERVAGEIARAGRHASAAMSATSAKSRPCATRCRRFWQAHGHIDGLVNNAGGQFPSPLETISAKGWDAVVRNNLSGGFLFARECYTQWMASTSRRPRAASSTSLPTCGTACRAWRTRALRAPACSISPRRRRWSGRRCASMRSRRASSPPAAWIDIRPSTSPIILAAAKTMPLRRLGTESEVSAAVVFLLSPAAAFISGACLRVDGAGPNARRMWPRVARQAERGVQRFPPGRIARDPARRLIAPRHEPASPRSHTPTPPWPTSNPTSHPTAKPSSATATACWR